MPGYFSLCNRFANGKICKCVCVCGWCFVSFCFEIYARDYLREHLWIAIDMVKPQLCDCCVCSFVPFFFWNLQKAFASCDLKSKHNNIILDLYCIANYVMDLKSKFETSQFYMDAEGYMWFTGIRYGSGFFFAYFNLHREF